MHETAQQVARLPKWAQRKIEVLEMRVEVLEMRVEEAARAAAIGPEDSNTFADPHAQLSSGRAPTPLGADVTVEYRVKSENLRRGRPKKHFHVRLDGEQLYIMGSHQLSVYPQSNNTIRLELR